MTAVFLPLMVVDQPDTASRKRSAEFDRIPFALPERRAASIAKLNELLGDRRAKLTATDIGAPACDEEAGWP